MDKAIKNDEQKIRMDLLPPDSLQEIAKVFTYGANKYDENNWEYGFEWHRLYAAAQRHLNSFWSGEDFDEVGNNHLAAAGCNILMLISHYLRNIGADDRPIKKENKKIINNKKNKDPFKEIEENSIIDLNRKGSSKLFTIGKYIICCNNIPYKDDIYRYDIFNTETNMIAYSFTSDKILNEYQIVEEIEKELKNKINNKNENNITKNNEIVVTSLKNELKTVKEKNNNDISVSLKDRIELDNYIVDIEYTRNNKLFQEKEVYTYEVKSKDGTLEISFKSAKKLAKDEILQLINNALNNGAKKESEHVDEAKFSYYKDNKHSYSIKMIKSKNKYKYTFDIDNNPKKTFYYNSNHELTRNELINLISERNKIKHE